MAALAVDLVTVGAVAIGEKIEPSLFAGRELAGGHGNDLAIGPCTFKAGEREIDDGDDAAHACGQGQWPVRGAAESALAEEGNGKQKRNP